jgi:uncharacterized membrane protein YedE/YeeE
VYRYVLTAVGLVIVIGGAIFGAILTLAVDTDSQQASLWWRVPLACILFVVASVTVAILHKYWNGKEKSSVRDIIRGTFMR